MVSNILAFPSRPPRPFSLSPRDRAEALAGVSALPHGWCVEFEHVREGDLAAFVEHDSYGLRLSYILGRCGDVVQVTRERDGAWEEFPEASNVLEAFAVITEDLIDLGFTGLER